METKGKFGGLGELKPSEGCVEWQTIGRTIVSAGSWIQCLSSSEERVMYGKWTQS